MNGNEFRQAVQELFEDGGDPAAQALLDQAVMTLDEIAALELRIETEGTVVEGSKGQPVANPVLKELRAHREAFARLADKLLPDERAETATELARRAGRARWGRR